jgi:hypothetical protein
MASYSGLPGNPRQEANAMARAKRAARAEDAVEKVRVTLRLPSALVIEAEHRRVDERRTLNALVTDALRAYLKGGR